MNKYKCSITIEASLSFSISLFVLFLILGPLFVLESSAYIMNKLNETSKYMSYYQMIEKNLSNFNDRIDIKNISNGNDNNIEIDSNLNNNDIKDSIKNLSNYGIIIADLFAKNVDKNNAYSNISLILPNNTQVYTENNGIIKYDLNIFFKLPLNLFRVPDLYQRFISVRRAFIGVDGNRFINEQGLVENEEIYVSNNKIFATKTKFIQNEIDKKNIYAGILPDIDKIKDALPAFIKDFYLLSKNNILAIDIAWRNLIFDGESLYAIDTLHYTRNEKHYKIDAYKWNIDYLQKAMLEFTDVYEEVCKKKNIPLSEEKLNTRHELPYYIKRVAKEVKTKDKTMQKIKRP